MANPHQPRVNKTIHKASLSSSALSSTSFTDNTQCAMQRPRKPHIWPHTTPDTRHTHTHKTRGIRRNCYEWKNDHYYTRSTRCNLIQKQSRRARKRAFCVTTTYTIHIAIVFHTESARLEVSHIYYVYRDDCVCALTPIICPHSLHLLGRHLIATKTSHTDCLCLLSRIDDQTEDTLYIRSTRTDMPHIWIL